MKITKSDLEKANARLSMLTYYPSEPAPRAAIMELLARMCPHREALEWLVTTMIDRVGRWPGPAELRGVLCTHFKPADGVERYSTISGFTPDDNENVVMIEHAEIQRLEKGKVPQLKALLAPETIQ